MNEWTMRQNELVREYGHFGVERVRDEIYARFGIWRTLHSIEAHASRIHVSLRKQTVCPHCGTTGVRLNRQTGLCKRCNEEFHLEEERAFNELLQAERDHAEDPEAIEEIRRRWDRVRKRNSRLCKAYGLTPKSRRP